MVGASTVAAVDLCFFRYADLGLVLLSILGLVEVWTDFRKLNPPPAGPQNNNDTG